MSTNTDVVHHSVPPDCVSSTSLLRTSSMEKVDASTPVLQSKSQILPLVYIQTAGAPKASISVGSSKALPQIQLQNIAPKQSSNPASVLLGKSPLVLQNSGNLNKNGVTYLTMLKPVSKPPDNVRANRLPITTISKIKSETTIQMISSQGKLMLAPMPSVTTNRQPVTMTTNSVQSKISLMPMFQAISPQMKGKVINVKLEAQKSQVLKAPVPLADEAIFGEVEARHHDKTIDLSMDEDDYERTSPANSDSGPNELRAPTVQDPQTKEVTIQTSESNPAIPIPIPVQSSATTKRSRKSTLCLRKDFHEIELEAPKKEKYDDDKKVDLEVDMINSVKSSSSSRVPDFNFNMLQEDDVGELLQWETGIGTLPGSNIRFIINEFGFLEYVTKDEYYKMKHKDKKDSAAEGRGRKRLQQPLPPATDAPNMQEELRCVQCGCFGLACEFINPKYCSTDCLAAGERKTSLSHKEPATNHVTAPRKRSLSNHIPQNAAQAPSQSATNSSCSKRRKVENGTAEPNSKEPSSDEESTDALPDKLYPWQCRKKGFSWARYLNHMGAVGAPQKLFKDPFPYIRNGFRPGMKLEGIDPQHQSYICVLSVAQVQGFRLQLHFDGYADCYDFWVNADSMDIFPAGFCEKYDYQLHPPPHFDNFNWNVYLKYTKATAAPKTLFNNRTGSAIFPTAFRAGMKLEAVDRKNSSLVCVATAKQLLDNRILIHFDGWDSIYDYWVESSSNYIHPVGWCDKNGHRLTPPSDYAEPENFTWEKYLKETNSVAAPGRAFKQRPSSGFKKGMRLESVDKRVQLVIRAATVVDVKEHRLRISFDGWPDRYAYWVDDDSSDIHPIGWCQKTGHPLEPPLTPDDVYDFLECPTVGCRGVGNMKGPHIRVHNSQKYCPYAEENIDSDHALPDRLIAPDQQSESIVPVSREPKTKKIIVPKKKYETNATKTEWLDDSKLEFKEFKLSKSPSSSVSVKKEHLEDEINLEEMRMRDKHSKYYRSFVKQGMDPLEWNTKHVCDFINSLPFARRNVLAFANNSIDGESLLLLTRQDLVEVLDFKLGPAIALYNCILLLRKNISDFT